MMMMMMIQDMILKQLCLEAAAVVDCDADDSGDNASCNQQMLMMTD